MYHAQSVERIGQRKHHMEVRHRKQVCFTRCNPLFALDGLTFWTMPARMPDASALYIELIKRRKRRKSSALRHM
jgi:hypothetical protein